MTAQAPDILFFGGRRYLLLTNPLESLYSEANPRPAFIGIRTDNWRGYVAQWRIDDGRLYLVAVDGRLRGDDPDDPTSTRRVALADLFPGNDGRVLAQWFSGTLRAPEGKLLQYAHGGYESVYERDRVFTIENGVVQGEQVVENSA